jgi:hypothetical protein
MYKEGEPVKMNRDFLQDDFDIDLNDKEYEKLLEYIEIQDDGKWWIESIRKRISKAEAARENGKKGGRPKTQKPSKKTQDENPKNPPYKRERENESKREIKKKENGTRALEFLKTNFPSRFETDFLMKYKSKIENPKKFAEDFNDTVDQEKLEFDDKVLFGRLGKYARNWIDNQKKYSRTPNPDSYESGKLPRI